MNLEKSCEVSHEPELTEEDTPPSTVLELNFTRFTKSVLFSDQESFNKQELNTALREYYYLWGTNQGDEYNC